MKSFLLAATAALLLAVPTALHAQSVGIGTTTPASSAVLDVTSPNPTTAPQGFLPPRLTQAQREAIQQPAAGLLVYQTDSPATGTAAGLYLYGGTSWSLLPTSGSPGGGSGDNLGNHTATQNLNLQGNKLVGGTAAAPGTEGLRISPDGLVTVGAPRVGSATTGYGLRLQAADAGFTITSDRGRGPTATPVTGVGSRLMWLPYYSAFRAGGISGFGSIDGQTSSAQWDFPNVGEYSGALGLDNVASGQYSFAAGRQNSARGESSVALGMRSSATGLAGVAIGSFAASTHSGAFAFSDYSSTQELASSADNQMSMRFRGGYRLYTNPTMTSGVFINPGGSSWNVVSDSTKKERRVLANGNLFLERINRMRLGSWNYIGQSADTMRHYGPMAQDFFAAFGHDGVGRSGDKTSINQADFDGINLIAIQALYRQVLELKAENARQQQQIQQLQARQPGPAGSAPAPTTAALEERLRRLEAQLSPQAQR